MADAFNLAYEKIIRAIHRRNEIFDAIAKYETSEPYATFLKPESEYEHWTPTGQPPVDIPILLGELIYQVRSALDHLFLELVKKNQGPVQLPNDKDWERACQFPIISKLPAGQSAPVPRDKFPSEARNWLSAEAFAHIEGIQPYYSSKNHAATLSRLSILSNIDKHRRLAVTVVKMDVTDTVVMKRGTISTTRLMIDPGAELIALSDPPEMPDTGVHLQRKLTPVIALDEPLIGPPISARVGDIAGDLCDVGGWIARNLGVLLNRP